jgi:hypothetical protein
MPLSFANDFTVVKDKRKSKPPPVTNLNETVVQEDVELGETGQNYVSNVLLEFRKEHETPLYHRVGALISRLKTEDANIQILASTTHPTLNPITEGKNVPSDPELFSKYFTNMTAGKFSVKFFVRVQTHKRINKFKRNRQIFDCLQQHRIYMKYNQLSATDITAIAWVHDEHPDAISRMDLAGRMTQMLPSKYSDFQLTARQVSYSRGSELKTRAWVIEMSREKAKEHFGEFLTTFNPGAAITIVPLMDPRLWDKQGNANQFYLSQNKMLRDAVVIKVDGLKGLEVFHEDSAGHQSTLRDLFLSVEISPGNKVMKSVTQFNTKRVCIVTTEANQGAAEQMVDKFLDGLNQLDNEEYKMHTFTGRKPVRIGKRNLPDEISVYTKAMTAMTIDMTDDDNTSVAGSLYTTPPSRSSKRSYIDIARGNQSKSQGSTPSLMSGPTMAASQFSELDDKIKAALEQMQTNSALMEEKQLAMDKEKETTEMKFRDLTGKLGSVVDMVKQTNDGQLKLQTTLEGQQAQLNQLSTILQEWIDYQKQEEGVPSPPRKKRGDTQAAESLDESPRSQA